MATVQRNRNSWASANGGPAAEIEMQSVSSQSNFGAATTAKAEKAFARLIRKTFHYGELDRALERPHIAAIAFSGTVGAGIFVTSGELIGISGSVGCVISYICAAFIIVPVMRTIAELMAIRPTSGALMDYPDTFVDPALGFAVGATYCLANCMSMATLTSAAAKAAEDFSHSTISNQSRISIIVGFFIITLLSNLCGIRLYANLERVVFQLKLALLVLVCILMILVKAGVGSVQGPQQEASTNSTAPIMNTRSEIGYGSNAIVPFFRFDGFNGPQDKADGGYGSGIPGAWGKFLAIWTTLTFALFTTMGGEIVAVTAGEAKRPRRDLPPVTRLIYLTPLTFYIIIAFLIGLSINYMDPRLSHPWAKPAPNAPITSASPVIIVLSDTSLKVLSDFLNACFMLASYTAGNTALFVSSRTLFSLSHLYGKRFRWIKGTFGTTNDGNTPVAAILACSLFSLLAFLGLQDPTFNQPMLSLSAFYTGAVCCVYASQCIAFLRFKSGLKILEEEGADVLGRDSDEYKTNYYRSHWQPACAITGLVGCTLIVLFSGWPAIYLLKQRNTMSTESNLKGNLDLIGDIIGTYSGPILFLTLFLLFKFGKGTTFRKLRELEPAYHVPDFPDDQAIKMSLWREIISFFVVDKTLPDSRRTVHGHA